MMMNVRILVLSLGLLVLVGCTTDKIYRANTSVCRSSNPELECRDSALQEYLNAANPDTRYLLGFIEFDDQGQLHARKQMRAVINKLYEDVAKEDLIMVVFVHGWKHSAEPDDSNIQTFRESLKRLSELESTISSKTEDPERRVVGIYIGWRGASVTAPVLKELSFWDRKNTAHKVGQGGVTEVLTRLELVKKTKDSMVPGKGQSRTRLVVVGHSFGGALVYSALSQIMMSRFVDTKGPGGVVTGVEGFGDLVVLINPAFEAMRFASLSDVANERRTYFPSQLPVLAILTSEADGATKRAFPFGRWFSTFFEEHRTVDRKNGATGKDETVDQKKANITAVGHFDPYKTHYLRATGISQTEATGGPSVEESVRLFFDVSQQWEDDKPGSVIEFKGSTLERTKTSVGRNPYLVIRVDKVLINDHNHIDDPRITSFIRQLILMAGQSADLKERTLKRGQIFTK